MRAYVVAGVIAAGLTAFTVWAWPPREELEPRVAQGNAAFAQREFPQALGHYESAPGDGPRNAGVHANRGLAKFRVLLAPGDGGVLPELTMDAAVPEGYSGAQDEIRNAARGMAGAPMEDIDTQVRARAQYNLGNTFFAEHSWRNAIDAYKEALRLRPGWVDAAWNLDLARRRKDEEDHPDAGPDAGQDASRDASNDAPPGDAPPSDGSSGGDGGGPGDGGGQQGDSGSQGNDSGAGGDSGSNGEQPDGGADQQRDASAPPPPQSLAPLDQLERNAQDLQQMMLRRRAGQTARNPDDER